MYQKVEKGGDFIKNTNIERSENTQRKIMQAATKVAKRDGWENTTLRKICKEANISIGGFYHHYSSKQDIVNTIFRLFDETLNESLDESYDNPLTAIKDILIKQTQFVVDEAGILISVYYKNILDDENSFATNPNRVYYQKVLSYTCKAIDEGLLSLKFSYEEITAEYITEFLIKFVRGCIVDWSLHKCKYDIVKRLDFEIDVLFKGLCS